MDAWPSKDPHQGSFDSTSQRYCFSILHVSFINKSVPCKNQRTKTNCFNELLKFRNSHRISISSLVRLINYSLVNFIFCVIRDYFYANKLRYGPDKKSLHHKTLAISSELCDYNSHYIDVGDGCWWLNIQTVTNIMNLVTNVSKLSQLS